MTLRNTLLHCLVTTLVERVENAISKPEHMAHLRTMGLVQDDTFVYLRWNQETKAHERSPQDPIEIATALECLKTVLRHLIFPRVLMRFHALRKLAQDMNAEVVPFTLEIHNRNQEAQLTYQAFERLCHCSLWHLIGGTLRMAKLGRGPLEKSLETAARKL